MRAGSGGFRVALCYPNRYPVAASSLGYQVVHQMITATPGMASARATLPDPEVADHLPADGVRTIEDEAPLSAYPVVAFSIAYEMDLSNLLWMMDAAGIPPLRDERTAAQPFVLVGGPMTLSNALPLEPFADAVVMGEAEEVLGEVLEALRAVDDRHARWERLARIAGVWVPALHGVATPEPLKVAAERLPAAAAWWTPEAELRDMFLVEASRGCPRYCKFCVVRARNTPMRHRPVEHILAAIPLEAPRVGFVGAAVSEYPQIKDALRVCVERGQEVGLSSLRADRLDDEFVGLLVAGGARTLTIASDAPSEAMRGRMAKALRSRHLLAAAERARRHGVHRLKIYVIVGLPGETDADIDELVRFADELSRVHKVTLAINPLVPKLRTPMAEAPFGPIRSIEEKYRTLQRRLRGRVQLRTLSPKWAWVEMRLSLGGPEAGLAALEVARSGGGFAAWKRALRRVERPFHAVEIAREAGREALLPRR